MNGHLSQDELIDRVYGLNPAADAHLNACARCRERVLAAEILRKESVRAIEIAPEESVALRARIDARLNREPGMSRRWAPVLAASCLLVAGLLVYQPGRNSADPVAPTPEIADEQLFGDIYSMQTAEEPLAAGPIRSLFMASSFGQDGRVSE